MVCYSARQEPQRQIIDDGEDAAQVMLRVKLWALAVIVSGETGGDGNDGNNDGFFISQANSIP